MNCENKNSVKSALNAALSQKTEKLLELVFFLVSMGLQNVIRACHEFAKPILLDIESFPTFAEPIFTFGNELKHTNLHN